MRTPGGDAVAADGARHGKGAALTDGPLYPYGPGHGPMPAPMRFRPLPYHLQKRLDAHLELFGVGL